VLTLGAVVLRTTKDHEAAIRLREAATILGRRPLIFGCHFVAVPALALATLIQHVIEEFTDLELVPDRVALIGARLFQELLEVVDVALLLACAVGRHDCIGVGKMPVLLLPFPCPEGPSFWSSRLALPLARPLTKTADRLLARGMIRGNVQELASGARLPAAKLVNKGLAGAPNEEHVDDVASTTPGRELHCLENR
jgi:hypothetical protein